MKKNPVTELRKSIKNIVGKEYFQAVGKMTDKQWRQLEDLQGLRKEPVSYEKKYCEKEQTVRNHAIDNRTAEVMCFNCGDLR
jgi:hypothetical protein